MVWYNQKAPELKTEQWAERAPKINWARVEAIVGTEQQWLDRIRPISIIGLGYKAGVGKQVAADYLTEKYGHFQLSFADPLRDAAQTLFGFSQYQMLDRALKEKADLRWGLSPRQALQQLGDTLRAQFGADFLIRIMRNRIDAAAKEGAKAVVIPDVRFLDETAAIKTWGGSLYQIDRDVPAVSAHHSETGLDSYKSWDQVLANNSTPQELFDQLDRVLGGKPGLAATSSPPLEFSH